MSEMNMREYNARLIEEYRANGGKLSGQLANSQLLLLTTTGAKTGQERVTPMGYRLDGDRIVVIAANAGAHQHPDWYYNLLAHPEVTVELGEERFAAHAVIANAAERERLIHGECRAVLPRAAREDQPRDSFRVPGPHHGSWRLSKTC